MPGTFNGQKTKTADVGSVIFVTEKLLQREKLGKVNHDCSLSEADVLVVQLYADPLPVHTKALSGPGTASSKNRFTGLCSGV